MDDFARRKDLQIHKTKDSVHAVHEMNAFVLLSRQVKGTNESLVLQVQENTVNNGRHFSSNFFPTFGANFRQRKKC